MQYNYNVLLTNLDPILRLGSVRSLLVSDIDPIPKQSSVSESYERFYEYWKEELLLSKELRSLTRPLLKTTGYYRQIFGVILSAISAGALLGPPLILRSLSNHFSGVNVLEKPELWILVSLLFAIPCIGGICGAHSYVIFSNSAIILRSALVPAVYRKSLVLANEAKTEFSVGRIMNLFSTDITNIQTFVQYFGESVFAPAQLAVALGLVYREVGTAMFTGLGLVFILLPGLLVLFGLYAVTKRNKSIIGDKRIALMNEVLTGIRIIKYYAWEIPFSQQVQEIRKLELQALLKLNILMVAIVTGIVAVPYVLPIVIFYSFAKISDKELDPTIAFTTLALLGLVTAPMSAIPNFLQRFFSARVSIIRILDFLQAPELQDYVIHDLNNNNNNNDINNNNSSNNSKNLSQNLIQIENVCAGWVLEGTNLEDNTNANNNNNNTPTTTTTAKKDTNNYALVQSNNNENGNGDNKDVVLGHEGDIEEGIQMVKSEHGYSKVSQLNDVEEIKPKLLPSEINRSVQTLINLDLSVKKGELIAIIGGVGSGKSSILSLIMGDIILNSGKVSVSTTNMAYHNQQPWIINATVRDNITCGLPLDEARLENAIEASCLRADLKILPAGLDTEIGEKGINLSGGQRARVSFARAVYRQAELYLLDDPLSAVDANVGDHMFRKGICTALKGKTVILVTHQVHLLDDCDRIIILRDGKIFAQGSPRELVESGIDFKEVLIDENEENDNDDEQKQNEDNNNNNNNQQLQVSAEELSRPNRSRTISSDHTKTNLTTKQQLEKEEKEKKEQLEKGKLMTEEEKVGGQVATEMYVWYFKLGGVFLLILAIVISFAGAGSYAYSSFYLSHWGKVAYKKAIEGNPLSTEENVRYLNRYGLYSSMAIVSSTLRTTIFVLIGIQASNKMHKLLLTGVVRSTVSHFDTTPIGRILNRFTTDLTVTDESLATNMSFVLSMTALLSGTIGSIAYTTKGVILVLFCPLIVVYYFVQLFFRRSNTELKRLENITRSPIYAEFSQTLSGVKSLRCYHLEDIFIKRIENFVDINSGTWLIQQLIRWWLMIRLEIMGGLISFFIAALAAGNTDFIDEQYISLSLQAAFSLVSTVKYLVTLGSDCEAMMNSVERIKHYSDSIAPEETNEIISKYKEIPKNWPEFGCISFQEVEMSYHGGPLVLKGVNFEVKSCEKIGIAGRTGCGKSSLMVSIYRFENLQGGKIEIDGIDISTVPLEILRSRIGIIPQEPVIFSVTVRFNLDPFNQYTDEQIYDVLESVCMKDAIKSLPLGLNEPVSEGGENFSVGQRQLICIARLLLRKPKILIMDESTSSIDNETDSIIQKMIRVKFVDCTILTIAHRLHTVIDSDRILVMDRGNVIQFDTPKQLTGNDGMFSNLWKKHVSSHSSKRVIKSND